MFLNVLLLLLENYVAAAESIAHLGACLGGMKEALHSNPSIT